ncbi:MAG: TolB protein [Myxococcota bacterium]|jgi:TolB protein
MRIAFAALLTTLAFVGTPDALAQDDGPGFALTVRAGDRSLPIALPQPQVESGVNAEAAVFWATLTRDLEMSGYFRIIDPNAYFEQADSGITPGSFDFSTWQQVRATALAKTAMRRVGGKLQADVYLYDVGIGNKIDGRRFEAESTEARVLAHRAADAILEALGYEGIFDSQLLAVRDLGPDRKSIYRVDIDGEGQRRLSGTGINLSPAWSADAGKFAYTTYINQRMAVVVRDSRSGSPRTLSSANGVNTGAAFSPNGSMIAIARSSASGMDTDIVLLDASTGSVVRNLTTGGGIDVNPSFSPDGGRVAFSSERSGGSQIFTVPAGGGEATRVTYEGSRNFEPRYSPDGTQIAFVSQSGGFDIFVVGIDGSGLRRITQGQGANKSPSWSPDGRYLAFSSDRSGRSEIWMSTADGRHQTQVTTDGGWDQPMWRP